MKKVLALVLAVLMVSTVALAAANVIPGKSIKIYKDKFADSGSAANGYAKFWVDDSVESDPDGKIVKDLTTENYSITGIRYNEGKTLIESVKINDTEERVEVKLKQDYSNVKEKTFDIEFTLNGKGKYTVSGGVDDGKKKSVPDVDFRIKGTVGYTEEKVLLTGTEDEVDLTGIDLENSLVKFAKAKESENEGNPGSAYAPLSEDFGANDELTLEVRVYDGNKMNLFCDTDAIESVLKANADSDAEMDFYTWEAEPTFDASYKLYFNDADEEHYVYQIKNGKLVKAGSYSEDDGCWVVKGRTLGSYVVSDKKLTSASGTTDSNDPADENPDTGANDVVGIATALAAVALVSAAAVSLKK